MLKNHYDVTPISWAVGNEYEVIVPILLAKHGFSPDLEESETMRHHYHRQLRKAIRL